MMDQTVLDHAVNIATKAALNGTPVEYIIWIPPTTAAQPASGSFAIKYAEGLSGSDTPPWEKY